jgi:hypothetical protein
MVRFDPGVANQIPKNRFPMQWSHLDLFDPDEIYPE